MPVIPFIQINEFACFFQNFLLAGIQIVLKKILLEKNLLLDFTTFLLYPTGNCHLRTLDHSVKILWIYRFQDIFRDTIAYCFLRKCKVAETTEYDDLKIRLFFLCLFGKFQPCHVRHFDVCKKKLYIFFTQNLQRLPAIGSFKDFVFLCFCGNQIFQSFSFNLLIIHDQNIDHSPTPCYFTLFVYSTTKSPERVSSRRLVFE